VALARALARNPGVLLLDEPLAALDAPTRARVRAELVELLRELALPTLIVTHDYQDAVALADKVGVIAWGRLRQLASARELIARPQDTFVASFTGANVLPGVASATAGPLTSVRLSDGAVIHSADRLRGEVAVVVYPWEVQVTRAAPSDAALNVLSGELRGLVQMPSSVRVSVGLLTAELSPANAALLDTQSGGSGYSVFRVADTRLLATG
jgi:molybdate transport system ATP-binding protein